jgi:hypothetical protein
MTWCRAQRRASLRLARAGWLAVCSLIGSGPFSRWYLLWIGGG